MAPDISATAGAPARVLEVASVSVGFGGLKALDDVSFDVNAGDICGLIGPNGAGKTTLFNCVTNLYRIHTGIIRFHGERIDGVAAHHIITHGIARTFQNLGIYPGMTVLENVLLGTHHANFPGMLASLVQRAGKTERNLQDDCMTILADLDLADVAHVKAGGLPYGTQKRIEIARALAARPKLLMLDEPAAGLTHAEVAEFGNMVRRIRDNYQLTILLVEHHMGLVMGLCNRLVVLNTGKLLTEGTPAEVRANPAVIAAYLGRAA